MLKICDKYLGEKYVCNLANIKKKLNDEFIKDNKKKIDINKETDTFKYYEESALCSVIAYYNIHFKFKPNENIFINQYKKIFEVYIYEIVEIRGKLQANKKKAIDAGGVIREFFTKLFEELFCDEDNKYRPFILPEKNGQKNRYYINPNFKPDENFRKVLNYVNINIQNIGNYTTEREYQNIYFIIGKILGVVLVNEEIGLPKQLSTYILSRFINPEKNIDKYDILYFYLRDFSNSYAYINMMSVLGKPTIDDFEWSFNDYYIISRSTRRLLTKNNYMTYMLQLSKHVVTNNFIFDRDEGSNKSMKGRYNSLFNGFDNDNKLRKLLYDKNVSIDTLEKLITNEQLDQAILSEFVEKMKISVIKYTAANDIHGLQRWIPTLTDPEKEVIINELKTFLTNIIIYKRNEETDEAHYEFIKKLLQFWTGFSYYDKHADNEGGYKFFYLYGGDTRRFPKAHTCSYQFDFFGFPANINSEDKEKFLYEKMKYAVFEAVGMDLA